MNIQSIVENELVEDEFSVWCLKDHTEFGYSDGASSDKYLQSVFNKSKDLSTRSAELESYIKDWPSEYHLTSKRAQLLSGFSFDRSLRVLEVGCGCGAITRHLGENFDEVVSVEGNINRARLARQRSRELDSVSVVCAPFQEIRFSQKFDIIFCIGVFEYSASFIGGDDPYEAALQYFSKMLSPDGIVVIAIENQFGLKYFCSAHEDHLGVMFEGLEGYHRNPEKVRTFGKAELEDKLKMFFPKVEFFYPYPDYKVPECVLSSEFLSSGHAGELVSQMRSRNYSGTTRELWNEAATILELDRNRMLDFFSNSFLVVAGRSPIKGLTFDQLAIMFSSGRKPKYSTQTQILKGETGEILVKKRKLQNDGIVDQDRIKLIDSDSLWIDSLSLLTNIMLRARANKALLAEIFEPCKKWIELLVAESTINEGIRYLDGDNIDNIWSNSYLIDGECKIIDREWVWEEEIRMNVVVIRAIYDFLSRVEVSNLHSKSLSARSGRKMIKDIGLILGINLVAEDFSEFIRIESEISKVVSGINRLRQSFYLHWFLFDRPTRRLFRRITPILGAFLSRVRARIYNLF